MEETNDNTGLMYLTFTVFKKEKVQEQPVSRGFGGSVSRGFGGGVSRGFGGALLNMIRKQTVAVPF
jgi:hypothetical protein